MGHALASEPAVIVQGIEDGDTLVVQIDGNIQRLQLIGIDAPEDAANAKLTRDMQRTGLDQSALLAIGVLATNHLGSLVVPGDQVVLEGALTKRDKYGRIPANVFNPAGRSLNRAMVEDGYAVILGRDPLPPDLKADLEIAEAAAIEAKRGIWGRNKAVARKWAGR